ncbi:uncharacterized protein LOC121365558 [Pyrgilauda ruficollis]|uniref:uncharacterized protein LOC121365558 n=1 Tax=Pyrgilauda ruficollis TaxID=221976 RepID=UPI001B8667B6|nr:uncharacterized protein LOC121365558 [Pyrgilauda ruficollis]
MPLIVLEVMDQDFQEHRQNKNMEETVAFLDSDSQLTAAMVDRKQEGPGAREPACMLCRRVEADPDICGDKMEKCGLCAHVFCMVRGSGCSLRHCNGQLLPLSPHQLLPFAAVFCHSAFSPRGGSCWTHGLSPSRYPNCSLAGGTEGESLTRAGRFVPGEVCQSLAQTAPEQGWPNSRHSWLPAALAQRLWHRSLPPPPGGSVGWDPAGATSCALPGAAGLPGEAPRLLLMGLLGSFQRCCVCGQSGATIMCCTEDCERWFHLPCAKEGGCVNHYVTPYRSFCPEHRPEQEVRATPEPGTDCPICLEPVEDRKTFKTMVCPKCKRAWFHRDCIQGQAMRAGALFFQCPLCRDNEEFTVQMFLMGIRVPFRLPTWEDNDAFAYLGERHSMCNARECLYPGGREEAEQEGPWELLLCSSCAAEGTHRRCSGLTNKTDRWECDSCAGLGTSSRDESELSGPSLARQSGQGSAHGSSESEDISPRSGTPVPSGLASPSPSPGTSGRNSQQHPASQQSLPSSLLDTSSPSRSRSTYSSSPDPEDRVHSRRAGPERRRNSSGPQGQDPNQPVRSRSRCDRSSRTGPTRLQRRASDQPVQSRSRQDSSRRTAASAECPRRRGTPSGMWASLSARGQRRRASTGTSNSST